MFAVNSGSDLVAEKLRLLSAILVAFSIGAMVESPNGYVPFWIICLQSLGMVMGYYSVYLFGEKYTATRKNP